MGTALFNPLSGRAERQPPFGVSIVLPTLLRPGLTRAIQSVFAQNFSERIQILVGIDVPEGDPEQLGALARECPSHIALDVVDPGYSTSVRHGGVHENKCSGSLRTVLTYLANSRFVAYLDDDNWWAPDHLSSLRRAIEGYDWSWSLRWFVEPGRTEPICVDEWESVGTGQGIFKEKFGGFVDPSSLMVDKLKCHEAIPEWSKTPFADGRGSDRLVFTKLAQHHRANGTGAPSSYYTINPADILHATRLRLFRQMGLRLAGDDGGSGTTLGELIAEWGGSAPCDAPAGNSVTAADPAFSAVVAHLKPTEALIFGDDDGTLAIELARTIATVGRSCPIVAVGPAQPTLYDRLTGKLNAARLGRAFALMPRELGGAAYLASRRVEADLIQLGPNIAGAAALNKIWPLLSLGGFMTGQGKINGVIERFAADNGSGVVPIKLPHTGAGWIIEKGVAQA